MPGDDLTHGSRATRSTGVGPQVQPESTGFPRAMVLRLIRALPGDLCLVATVVREINPATLAPASERQDHTTSPSAGKLTRLVNCRVHRIPLPTSVTIAIRP